MNVLLAGEDEMVAYVAGDEMLFPLLFFFFFFWIENYGEYFE